MEFNIQNNRLCTEKELKTMGRRHVDKVLDAIESGDIEESVRRGDAREFPGLMGFAECSERREK